MKGEVLKIVFKDDMAFLTKEVALDGNSNKNRFLQFP